MGTNFYRVKKYDSFNKELAHYYISVGKLLGEDSLESLINDLKNQIHICKISAGWQVLFDHNNGEYYNLSKKSLSKFLKEEGYNIIDEYGQIYSSKAFWQLVSSHNKNEHNNFYGEIYAKEVRDTNYYATESEKERIQNLCGITPIYADFQSNGLRWSVHTNFC